MLRVGLSKPAIGACAAKGSKELRWSNSGLTGHPGGRANPYLPGLKMSSLPPRLNHTWHALLPSPKLPCPRPRVRNDPCWAGAAGASAMRDMSGRCRKWRQCSVCAKRARRGEKLRGGGKHQQGRVQATGQAEASSGTSRGDGRRIERHLSAARPRGPPRSPCGTAAYQANRSTPTPAGSAAGQQSEPRRPSAHASSSAAPVPGRA
jgi:hypothetical protein